MHRINVYVLIGLSILALASCSTGKSIQTSANRLLVADSTLINAHTGIAVYDPVARKFLYQYQADKYFVPASNVKIFTCYAGMKILGNMLTGIRWVDMDTAMVLIPTGDPTFLHKDYLHQPVADFIRSINKKIYMDTWAWNDNALGFGWSWDDYSDYYMAERSAFPVYGNVVRWYQVKSRKENPTTPADTIDNFVYSDPEIDSPVDFGKKGNSFRVERKRESNAFTIFEGPEKNAETDIPYLTNGVNTGLALIADSLHREIALLDAGKKVRYSADTGSVLSRPVDSVLRPMMYRSDNFFAEQILLICGQTFTGELNSRTAINEISYRFLSGLPQKIRWVDGSGLSRYNLVTPADLVWVLDKMKSEFSWDRITGIFPTGGTGTLKSYGADSGRLFAKTGTLSGVMALSGYVITRKNKTLIFSILINNHQQSSASLRTKMAAFLKELIEQN